MSKKLLLSTALAAGTIALSAHAQEADSRYHNYIKGFGGVTAINELSESYLGYSAEVEIDTGFVVGVAAGVSFDNFELEGEVAYRKADTGDATVSYGGYSYSAPIDGEVNATSFMVNTWYNFGLGQKLDGYAGGGIGTVKSEAKGYGYSDDTTDFGWQVGAGVAMPLESGFSVGVGYRYFSVPEVGELESDVTSNDLVFEVKKKF